MPLSEKEDLLDSTSGEKDLFQFSLSIILCVIALSYYFREPENKVCDGRGCDRADVFLRSGGGGQS